MIIDGHHHIEYGHAPILAQMNELAIDKAVLVGIRVRDLSVATVRKLIQVRKLRLPSEAEKLILGGNLEKILYSG